MRGLEAFDEVVNEMGQMGGRKKARVWDPGFLGLCQREG